MPVAPNILWIVATQWRAQATGYAGDRNARTPHLDALAARAVNYAEAVTPHPFGPFARAGLLTGVPCPDNGVRDYYDPLPEDAPTIARRLNARGYLSAFFGNWQVGRRDRLAPLVGEDHARAVVPPEARGGFLFWEGFEGGFQLNDPWLHGSRLRQPIRLRGYQSDVLAAWAADWIRQQTPSWLAAGAPPWFVLLSLEPPHPPYDAALPHGIERPDEASLVLRPNVPRGGEVERRARRELAGYYAHIEATDRALGRLLATVPQDAIVVFTAVHGDMHGSHGRFRKGWPYEESIRVPLLVRGAPGCEAGETNRQPVSLLDLPDMAEAWAEGQAWACRREVARISMPSVVDRPDQCDRVWHAERSSDRKRVLAPDGTVWFDSSLSADPYEMDLLG